MGLRFGVWGQTAELGRDKQSRRSTLGARMAEAAGRGDILFGPQARRETNDEVFDASAQFQRAAAAAAAAAACTSLCPRQDSAPQTTALRTRASCKGSTRR